MAGDMVYELEKVSYSYLDKFPALKNINLSIREGERLVLLGANGSGKSTLLLVLAALIFPKDGAVKFSGKTLKETDFTDHSFQQFFRSTVGVVFQNPDIQLFNSSVEDEVLFGLLQLGLPKGEVGSRLEKYLKLMDIADLRYRHPQNLSIGEKKRVAIAATLAMEPKVILLDEPTAGLDPRTQRHLLDTMVYLGTKGYTLITATHDIHIVNEIADRVIVLNEEKSIIKDGGMREVMEDRKFLEANNLVHVHAHRHDGTTHVHPHEHHDHEHKPL